MRAWRGVGTVALGLVLGVPAPALATVSIQAFSLQPADPDTGDPVVLTASILSTSSCEFQGATMAWGPQPELGGQPGWGIDIQFRDGALPVVTTCPVETHFGTLVVASGDGVVRARNNGLVNDTAFFTLSVAPGPVAGWDGPTLHGGYERLTQSAALTALPGRLAMSDLLRRRIVFIDPKTGDPLSEFIAPGSGDVRGLAFDGTSLYAAVRDIVPRIYKLDLLGRVLDVFPSPIVSPGSAPLEGLACLDGVLYGSYESPPTLFAIDPSTHQKLWQRALPGRILALDAAPEGILGAEATGSFYFIEPSPTGDDVLLSDPIDTGMTDFPNLGGLAYDGAAMYAWDSNSNQILFMRTFGIWWAVDGTLRAYVPPPDLAVDVIRGDIRNIAQLAGYLDLSFDAPAVCLASRSAGGVVAEPDHPPAGHVFFYLARFIDANGSPGSYGRTTAGFRRLDTREACP
ncbi:MAG TPA: hypothetical protein VGV60_12260 [Candidatus Polarisedimenticolia bacterium]|nr:hypothetical protein [Candidatus Polarisedimenticolia bacterium]